MATSHRSRNVRHGDIRETHTASSVSASSVLHSSITLSMMYKLMSGRSLLASSKFSGVTTAMGSRCPAGTLAGERKSTMSMSGCDKMDRVQFGFASSIARRPAGNGCSSRSSVTLSSRYTCPFGCRAYLRPHHASRHGSGEAGVPRGRGRLRRRPGLQQRAQWRSRRRSSEGVAH